MTRWLFAALLLVVLPVVEGRAAEAIRPCPPEPMRVSRSIGQGSEYHGTYPGIPDLCRMVVGGQPGLFYYGAWRSDWPGAGDAYPAIKAVIDAPPGTRAQFVTRSLPGLQWTDSFTNGGHDDVVVNGVVHHTVKIAHERDGIEGNTYHSIITQWRDLETGVTLKVVENQIAGQSYGPATTWVATGMERLPE